ncbi:MAG: NYN domain-containing protein [Proteobacteria bacterium]|nr:NYN domain-containing protein [Pseudomonadota bacterium]
MESIVMIDGGFLVKKYKTATRKHLEAEDVKKIANNILATYSLDGESHRIYYYDCPPNSEETLYPISKTKYSFGSTTAFKKRTEFINALKKEDFFSVREGVLAFKGWVLKDSCFDKRSGQVIPSALTDDCFKPNLQQKGVDTKIGLDIAWASYEKIAKNILLVTGDSDFVPAMKTARRNGVFVYLFTMNHGVRQDILLNADVLNEQAITNFLT